MRGTTMFKTVKFWWKVRKLNKTFLAQARHDSMLPPHVPPTLDEVAYALKEFRITAVDLNTCAITKVNKVTYRNVIRNI